MSTFNPIPFEWTEEESYTPLVETGLPQIGNIRIGEKRVNQQGKEYPVSLDYFIAQGDFADNFTDAFGAAPSLLPIAFTSSNRSRNAFARFEIRKGSKLFAIGDGVNFRYWNVDLRNGNGDWDNISFARKSDFEAWKQKISHICQAEWSLRLDLRFIVVHPSLPLGEWKFTTGGAATTIRQILEAINATESGKGYYHNLLFTLRVDMVTADSLEARRYPVVSLIPMLDQASNDLLDTYKSELFQMEGVGVLAALGPKEIHKLLPAKEEELPADQFIDRPHTDDLPTIQVEEAPEEPETLSLVEARKRVKVAVNLRNEDSLMGIWDNNSYLHENTAFAQYCLDFLKAIYTVKVAGMTKPKQKELYSKFAQLGAKIKSDANLTETNA